MSGSSTIAISPTQKFLGRFDAEPINMSDNAVKGFVIFSSILIVSIIMIKSFVVGNPFVDNIVVILITLYVLALSIWYLIYSVNRYA
jgi:hypothetical protein